MGYEAAMKLAKYNIKSNS